MNIYSIKNEKLGFFNRPIYCESDAEALSYIQNVLMSDADRALSGLKDDLSLYWLGCIDFTLGDIYAVNCECYEDIHALAGDNLKNPCIRFTPEKICSLRDIFDTIPEDKLKPALTRDDVVRLYEEIERLKESLHNSATNFEKHFHNKKGDVII